MKLVDVMVLAVLFAFVSEGNSLSSPSPHSSEEKDVLEHLQALRDELTMMQQAYDRASVSSSMKITVQSLTGGLYTFDVDSDDTVYDVKVMIEQEAGYPVSTQKLVYAGKPIKNDKALSDYNIQDGATLHLILQLPSACDRRKARLSSVFVSAAMQIKVHTRTGGLFSLDVDTGNTVEEVYSLIEEEQGIPADQQRLIYNGKALEYCLTLAEYNIPDGADITLQHVFSGRK